MADPRQIVRVTMKALIDRLGCLDAAAETINARWGAGSSKGTLSKKLSGHLAFNVDDVIALEDAIGDYPVTKLLAKRLRNRTNDMAECLITQTGIIAKESGDVVHAVLRAEQSACANDAAQAIIEIREAIAALQAAEARLTENNPPYQRKESNHA